MITFVSSRALTLVCFLVLPPLCHAHECKIGTATAPLHAAVGGGHRLLAETRSKSVRTCRQGAKIIVGKGFKRFAEYRLQE